jgi:U4/U6 small nuclear ribonucleoprotein PRP4
MSDDEINYVKKQKLVHFGSIEEKERQRIASKVSSNSSIIPNNQTKGPNINISDEYLDIEKEVITKEKQSVLEEFERRKKARQIAVSTDDIEVRAHLRQLNEPICISFSLTIFKLFKTYFLIKGLFGEGPADRRERLRQLLARLGQDAIKKKKEDEKDEKDREVFIYLYILYV